ncbi:MAG: ABC transporter permease, partial [Verrucomicrobiota bacterium]
MSETLQPPSAESLSVKRSAQEHLSPNQRAWRRFRRSKPAVFSAIFLIALLILILAWPMISHYKPDATTDAQFQPPTSQHWFGTDVHGRDLLTRTFYGARISLIVGAVGAFVSLIIGVTWGAVAGYVGGRTDNAMMRGVDILYALPSIIFVIVLKSAFEKDLKTWLAQHFSITTANYASMVFLFIGLGAVSWLTMSRIVRGQVLSLRSRNFVEASKALGASHARILIKHILPNIYGIIIVYLTLTVPAIILYES